MPEGRGIANTRERLRALYGGNASLDVTALGAEGTRAVLRVPYKTKEREPGDDER
jgi:LytS/YehU family sensor histidine kinase